MLSRIFLFIFIVLLLGAACVAGYIGYVWWDERQPHETPYDPIIVEVARNDGIDPFLIRALIWRESRFEPHRHGSADERGLMQVTPDVGQMWAKANKIEGFQNDDLYLPDTNIRAGVWYLQRALKKWNQADDPVPFALAEYNAGRSNALKWVDPLAPQSHTAFLERITFPSTRKYVDVIMIKREEYREKFADNRWYKDEGAPVAAPATTTPATNQ